MGVTKGRSMRTFRVPGLEHEDGRAVLEVGGEVALSVDVRGGSGTLGDGGDGDPRVAVTIDSREALDGLVDGSLHPMVAALQNRLFVRDGDQRFGLCVLLALRASAPRFANPRRP